MLGHSGGFSWPNTFSSYNEAKVMNSRYHTISMTPSRLSSFHPFKCTDANKNTTVESRDSVEYVRPVFEV